jgi:outer membrane lipoprotein-sorting protein
MNKTAMRWLPAAVLPVVVVAAAVAVPAFAEAPPSLPEKSAEQVLTMIADSADATYSGTVEQSSDFGLPDISALTSGSDSGSDGSAMSTALELLTGSHTARVYVGGPDTSRLQIMDTLAERDVVRNGDDVWFYDSDAKEATHLTLSDFDAEDSGDAAADDTAVAVPTTPADVANKLLDGLDSSTTVTVSDTARVAGRDAYTLTLDPKSDTTLVDSVALSVDSETGLPLAVTVSAADQEAPAFSVAFSEISFAAPDASLFNFTPPDTATVIEKDITPSDLPETPDLADHPEPTVVGKGWDTVVILPSDVATNANADAEASDTDAPSTDAADAAGMEEMLGQLTTEVAEGRAFQTSLVTVLFATDGRILVGAVPLEQLQAAATAAQ